MSKKRDETSESVLEFENEDIEIEKALYELTKQRDYLKREIKSNDIKVSSLIEQARGLKRENRKAAIKLNGLNRIIAMAEGFKSISLDLDDIDTENNEGDK